MLEEQSQELLGEVINASVVSTETAEEGYTLYVIEVQSRVTEGTTWRVYRRFSNFLQFQSKLKAQEDIDIATEAQLHAGLLASSTAPEVVDRRINLINDFIKAVLNSPYNGVSEEFFRIPSVETPSNKSSGFVSGTTTPSPEYDHYATGSRAFDKIMSDFENRNFTQVRTEINKFGETRLSNFIIMLMGRISNDNEPAYSLPSVNSVYALSLLHYIICTETNLDSACIVHTMKKNIPNEKILGFFAKFIRFPTCTGSRLMAFKILKAIGMSPFIMNEDDSVVAQYMAWLESGYLDGTRDDMSGPTSGGGAVLIGPNSPLAHSVFAGGSGAAQRVGHASAIAALESREWVAFAASSRLVPPGVSSALPVGDYSWTQVPIPVESQKRIAGQILLRYRVNPQPSSSSGGYEVKLEWRLPLGVDIEKIVNLIWDPTFAGDTSYFGFLSPAAGIISECAPVGGEQANLTESVECVLLDSRRIGGMAVVQLLRSCMRSFNRRIVIAATTDPVGQTSANSSLLHNANVRRIKHLHFMGCEVDPDRNMLTMCGLLSSESIFLIACDLLGERQTLWRGLERFSSLMMATSSVPSDSKMSEWLRMSSILIQ